MLNTINSFANLPAVALKNSNEFKGDKFGSDMDKIH